MLATAYSFSNGGKTLTLTTRSGVKWSDGKPFSAADVAFTFNLIAKNPALRPDRHPGRRPAPPPPGRTRWCSRSPSPAGGQPVPHRHPGHRVPARLAVGEQPVHLRRRQPGRHRAVRPGQVHPAGHLCSRPTRGTGTRARSTCPRWTSRPTSATPRPSRPSNPVRSTGRATTSRTCRTCSWPRTRRTTRCGSTSNPYMTSNNVVTLWLNTTKAPLNDPKVRQAISYAADRQQLADQGETGYELPATSSSGLLLPVDQSLLQSQYANDLPATGDASKVASILTSDGYTKVNGKWTQERQADQLLGRGPDLVQRLLARRPAADGAAEQDGLRRQGRRHRQRDQLVHRPGHRQLRRDDPLVQQRPHPVLLLLQLDGQHHQRADRQDRGEQLRPVQRPAGPVRAHAST